jgi:hypothetical protein
MIATGCYPCVYKTCASCGKAKPLSAFASDPISPDDLKGSCNKCAQQMSKSKHPKRKRGRRAAASTKLAAAAVKFTHKKCGGGGSTGCGLVLPVEEFGLWGGAPDGLRIVCRKCEAAYQRERKLARYVKDPLWYWAQKMKARTIAQCRAKGQPCDITAEWCLEWLEDGVCQQTGLPLDIAMDEGPRSPSIDRIDPSQLGHMQDNCRVVMQWINFAKHDYEPKEFDQLLCQIAIAPGIQALVEKLSLTSPPSIVHAPSAGGLKVMGDDEWKSTILSVGQVGSMTDATSSRSVKTVTPSSIRARG